ncbi:hypothetical protein HZA76_04960 [Candidatus Roizmanbacteria bacterium]|nr:hypothetical protein [Candidatus Roizmanbacteria bacterium]
MANDPENRPRINYEKLRSPVGGIIEKKNLRYKTAMEFEKRRNIVLGIIAGAIVTCFATGIVSYEIFKPR